MGRRGSESMARALKVYWNDSRKLRNILQLVRRNFRYDFVRFKGSVVVVGHQQLSCVFRKKKLKMRIVTGLRWRASGGSEGFTRACRPKSCVSASQEETVRLQGHRPVLNYNNRNISLFAFRHLLPNYEECCVQVTKNVSRQRLKIVSKNLIKIEIKKQLKWILSR